MAKGKKRPSKSPRNDETAEEIRERLLEKPVVEEPNYLDGLSTGSTLINLACTGRPDVGFVRGGMFNLAGSSNSGKTWISLACFAEAAQNPRYDDYRFFYDASEIGAQMSVRDHFGSRMADRLESPCYMDDTPWHSETIEDFYFNLDEVLSQGPCIYVLDSMEGLDSHADDKTFQAAKQAHLKGTKPEKGSYGMDRAKKNSQYLRRMIPKLAKTGSILIIINQTRDDPSSPYGGDTKGGGRAITFFAQIEAWSKPVGKLKSGLVREKQRYIGNMCEFHIRRSRYTGHEAKVRVPIYFNSGVDDTGSCVDFLVSEAHWKKDGSSLVAPELGLKCPRAKLIEAIEEGGWEDDLRDLTGLVWRQIEEESGVKRKKRYT